MNYNKYLDITYYGHSCFKVDLNGHQTIFDPYNDNVVPNLKPLRIEGNYVMISHYHKGHDGLNCVNVIEGKVNPFEYTFIWTFHDDNNGDDLGFNLINIHYNDDFKIAHFGDLGHMLKDEDIATLKDFDVIMIPIGGVNTINIDTAISLIEKINSKLAILMHYKTDKYGKEDLSSVNDFKAKYCNLDIINSNTYRLYKNDDSKVIALSI